MNTNCSKTNCPIPYQKGEIKVPCGIRNHIKYAANICTKKNRNVPQNFCRQAELYRKAQTEKYENKCGKAGGKSKRRSTRKNKTRKNKTLRKRQ